MCNVQECFDFRSDPTENMYWYFGASQIVLTSGFNSADTRTDQTPTKCFFSTLLSDVDTDAI